MEKYQGHISYKVIIINQKKELNNIPSSNKTLKDTHFQYSHKMGGGGNHVKSSLKILQNH